MSTLVLATYQTLVRRALGNIPTSFPQLDDGMDITAINAAPNTLIRRYPQHFPECRNHTWTIGPTIVGDNTIALPAQSSFTNQPANDGVEVISSSAADTTQTATVIGTTYGTINVVRETVSLNGVTQVATTKTDWGTIRAVRLSAACAGTVTVREASANATITTLAAGVLAKDVTPKLLELHRVVSNANDTTPSTHPGDWSETDEQPVPMVPVSTIGYSSKDSDLAEYPSTCERMGSDLIYWPTTRTGKTCYLRLYGLRGDLLLSTGDSFLMDADYDDAIVFEAAAAIATSIGWYAKASELRGYVVTHMQQLRPAGSGELAARPSRFRLAGMPRT